MAIHPPPTPMQRTCHALTGRWVSVFALVSAVLGWALHAGDPTHALSPTGRLATVSLAVLGGVLLGRRVQVRLASDNPLPGWLMLTLAIAASLAAQAWFGGVEPLWALPAVALLAASVGHELRRQRHVLWWRTLVTLVFAYLAVLVGVVATGPGFTGDGLTLVSSVGASITLGAGWYEHACGGWLRLRSPGQTRRRMTTGLVLGTVLTWTAAVAWSVSTSAAQAHSGWGGEAWWQIRAYLPWLPVWAWALALFTARWTPVSRHLSLGLSMGASALLPGMAWVPWLLHWAVGLGVWALAWQGQRLADRAHADEDTLASPVPDPVDVIVARKSARYGLLAGAGVCVLALGMVATLHQGHQDKVSDAQARFAQAALTDVAMALNRTDMMAGVLREVIKSGQVASPAQLRQAAELLVGQAMEHSQIFWIFQGEVALAFPTTGSELPPRRVDEDPFWAEVTRLAPQTPQGRWWVQGVGDDSRQRVMFALPVWLSPQAGQSAVYVGLVAVSLDLPEAFDHLHALHKVNVPVALKLGSEPDRLSPVWNSSFDSRAKRGVWWDQSLNWQGRMSAHLLDSMDFVHHQHTVYTRALSASSRLQGLYYRLEVQGWEDTAPFDPVFWGQLAALMSLVLGWGVAQLVRRNLQLARTQDLFNSLNQARDLLQASVTGMLTFADNQRCAEANQQAADLLRLDMSDLLGRRLDRMPEWATLGLLADGQATLDDGLERRRLVTLHPDPDHHVTLDVHISRQSAGRRHHLLVQLVDMTLMQSQQQALLSAQKTQDELTYLAHVSLGERNFVTQRVTFDRLGSQWFGIPPEAQARGINVDEFVALVHPSDQWKIKAMTPLLRDPQTRHISRLLHMVLPGGDKFIQFHWRVERNRDGRPTRMTAVLVDQTSLQMALDSARATLGQLQRYQRVIDLHNIVAVNELDGRLSLVNDAFCDYVGYRRDDLIGVTNTLIRHDSYPDSAYDEIRAQVLRDGIWHGVVPNRHRQGHVLWCIATIVLIPGERGEPATMMSLRTDITALKENEQALLLAKRDAEAANQAKSQFLSNMSHELRTPLNALLGYGRMLAQTALNDEQTTHVGRLNRAGNNLLALINDILDFSKIEAGEFHLDVGLVNLQTKLDDVRDVMGVLAQPKGIELQVAPLPESLQRPLLGDKLRIRQMLNNLVGNAIKFTEQGRVSVAVTDLGEPAPGRRRVRIEVADTGIGIAPEVLPKLFNRFSQADDGSTRQFGGTGLGLAITRELALRMGGGADVRSTVGQGSVFGIELVLGVANEADVREHTHLGNEAPLPSADTQRLPGVCVLLVDDSEMNLEVASQLLINEGAEVHTCTHGRMALEWLHDIDNAERVDVVLMDVHMPVMDGNTAVRLLREDRAFQSLPIIAMTAGATRTDRDTTRDAGMNDFLAKPFDPDTLLRKLREWVQIYRGMPVADGPRKAGILGEVRASGDETGAPSDPTASPGSTAKQAEWPVLQGIDIDGARHRLQGNWAHYLKQVRRLMDEFADMAEPLSLPTEEVAQKALAGRVHKLAGNSGMLGAMGLMHAAKGVEVPLKSGDLSAAQAAVPALANAYRHWLGQCAPLLDPPQARREDMSAAGEADRPALDLAALTQLLRQLDQQAFTAIGAFEALSPVLARHLSADDMKAVGHAMDSLDFETARALLLPLANSAADPG